MKWCMESIMQITQICCKMRYVAFTRVFGPFITKTIANHRTWIWVRKRKSLNRSAMHCHRPCIRFNPPILWPVFNQYTSDHFEAMTIDPIPLDHIYMLFEHQLLAPKTTKEVFYARPNWYHLPVKRMTMSEVVFLSGFSGVSSLVVATD